MLDLIEKEKAVRAYQGGTAMRLARHAVSFCVLLLLAALGYAGYATAGFTAAAKTQGVVQADGLHGIAQILRDGRDIPHIRAHDAHDAFFAEGYAAGSDRLFQMDLLRRYAYGQLAEILGPIQLRDDVSMRAFGIRDIALRQWRALTPQDRSIVQAYASGVNAAIRSQPLPVEFRLLLYRPKRWAPSDSLAVALVMTLAVGDTVSNVLARDETWRALGPQGYARALPLSDAHFDVAPPRALARVTLPASGSNAWALGGARTAGGHALLANDPHLGVSIPNLWYAVEMRANDLHVAGVTIPGIPGIVLGHNERIAWASTNAMASTLSLFHGAAPPQTLREERFYVRFARDRVFSYARTKREFSVPDAPGILVRWPPYEHGTSPVATVLALDRSQTLGDALRALARYDGPPQNFALISTGGSAAYHLAGAIPDDPAWGRYVHPQADLRKSYALIPFRALPAAGPSRKLVTISANNKPYGHGYPYRLSAMFAPPYRAYRIAQLLANATRFDTVTFARMQLDDISNADAAFAHSIARYARMHAGFIPARTERELATWDGAFSPSSRAATLEHAAREAVEKQNASPYAPFASRGALPGEYAQAIGDTLRSTPAVPWAQAGRVRVFHPFGPIGFPFLNGAGLPGDGDAYTIRMQTSWLAQSFRAVWDAGNWDSGGISLPDGESGEPGSGHYDDLRASWLSGALEPLPFSDPAVLRAARATLTLKQ